MHFTARVTDVERNTVKLEFLNVRKDPIAGSKELVFSPPADLDLTVNGRKVKASSLKEGDVLEFWVPENLLGFNADPESTALIELALN